MKLLRIRTLPLLALFALVAVGCSDAPTTAPERVDADAALLGGVTGTVGDVLTGTTGTVTDAVGDLTALRRTEPVSTGVCAEETIGRRGGTIVCEEAGLRLEFPRHALGSDTRISVTVPRGDLVGYEFEPHGIEFRKDVRLRQSLEGTEAEERSLLDLLVGVYVEEIDDLIDPLELLPAVPAADGDEVVIDIRHFSGYICATN